MDPARLGAEVVIAHADDDSRMMRPPSMELNEVLAIEGEDRAPIGDGTVENISVAHALTSLACLMNRQYVVTESTQDFNHRERKILVREQPPH
jgi:hypothetical protein